RGLGRLWRILAFCPRNRQKKREDGDRSPSLCENSCHASLAETKPSIGPLPALLTSALSCKHGWAYPCFAAAATVPRERPVAGVNLSPNKRVSASKTL